jgi:hypothetical protein
MQVDKANRSVGTAFAFDVKHGYRKTIAESRQREVSEERRNG